MNHSQDDVGPAADLAAKRLALLDRLQSYGPVVVALSGGVDSAVVARAAHQALDDQAVAVTGVSASLPAGEAQQAAQIAAMIGIRHELIETRELADPSYVANQPDRCYHCKSELYARLESLADRFPGRVLVNGANADDADDFRPGMVAAEQHSVRSPLLECGLRKADVRALARDWGLPVWDKPASPCLSSRIAYGQSVSPERLQMIDQAERFLRGLGISPVRVRYHEGDLARVEAPLESLTSLADEIIRQQVVRELRSLGFRYVTIDLAGFRSGSLNEGLPVATIELLRREW